MDTIHDFTAVILLEELTSAMNSKMSLGLDFSLWITPVTLSGKGLYDVNVTYMLSGNPVFNKTVRFDKDARMGKLSGCITKLHSEFMHEVFMEGLISLKFKQSNKGKDEN